MPALVLVGAGHAHLQVVKHAADLHSAGYRIHLLAPRFFDYSGVASATAAGVLASDAGRIDVRSLANASRCGFTRACWSPLISRRGSRDLQTRVAVTSHRDRLFYDVLSIDIGSVVAPVGMHVDPAVVRVKPVSGLAEVGARLRSSAHSGATVAVVGGGGSGLELAAHLLRRTGVAQVRMVESGAIIGADLPIGARKRVMQVLNARGVAVHPGCVVRELGERALVCDDGPEISYDLALLATGLTAPLLLADVGLGDGRGVRFGPPCSTSITTMPTRGMTVRCLLPVRKCWWAILGSNQ